MKIKICNSLSKLGFLRSRTWTCHSLRLRMAVFRLEGKLDDFIYIVPWARTKAGAYSPKGSPRSLSERHAQVRYMMLSLI